VRSSDFKRPVAFSACFATCRFGEVEACTKELPSQRLQVIKFRTGSSFCLRTSDQAAGPIHFFILSYLEAGRTERSCKLEQFVEVSCYCWRPQFLCYLGNQDAFFDQISIFARRFIHLEWAPNLPRHLCLFSLARSLPEWKAEWTPEDHWHLQCYECTTV
jgi:hypothetical protein